MVIIKIIIDKNNPIDRFIIGPDTDHWGKGRDRRKLTAYSQEISRITET
jgi:hypothetical protein